MNKNAWWGKKCETCETRYSEDYLKDPLYCYNSCYETLSGLKLWSCGQCVEAINEGHKKAIKLKKGIVSQNKQLV